MVENIGISLHNLDARSRIPYITRKIFGGGSDNTDNNMPHQSWPFNPCHKYDWQKINRYNHNISRMCNTE